MKHVLYHYKAYVVSVYDGDTVTVDIDLGLRTWIKGEKIRLHRINAPEIRGASRNEGVLSRDFLKSIVLNKEVVIETIKDKKGKYGRYLGELWLKQDENNFLNVNDEMAAKGFAKYQKY